MKKMCVLIIGCFLTAVGFGCVVIPCGFASAGVTGLARIACLLIPVSLSVMVMIINVVLFAAGYYFVGKQFVMKSLVCALLFPVFLEICQSFPAMEFLMEEKLISAMIAGVLIGVGAGMILRSDASSGGLDVIAVIIEKKFSVLVSVTNGVLDGMVLLFQGLYGSVSSVVYGLIVVLVISFVIKRVMTSGTGVVQFMIFSDHPMEIREMLLHRTDTGVTLFETVSGMRNTSAYTVMSVVPFQKAYEVRKMITQMDPEAFVTMSDVRSVTGRGYTMPAV